MTRLAALIIELDNAKLSEQAQAELVDDITAVIGQPPAAVVRVGHGQHVYWPLDRSDTTELSNAAAAVLATRWGYLIGKLGARFHGKVDSVFDLARVLRVPGTTNCKDPGAKVPVVGLSPGRPTDPCRRADRRARRARNHRGRRDRGSPRRDLRAGRLDVHGSSRGGAVQVVTGQGRRMARPTRSPAPGTTGC